MKIAKYDTSLTDDEWALLEPMLPRPKKRGRPPTDRRRVVDAICYMLKGGIPWRLLPHDFPPCKTVFHIFRQWERDHTWAGLNDRLRALVRAKEDKRARPTAAILDSQSVKSDGPWRSRRLRRDQTDQGPQAPPPGGHAGPAPRGGGHPGQHVRARRGQGGAGAGPWLRLLWVDGGYAGDNFAQWVKVLRSTLEVEVVKRSDDTTGFKVLPRRWVVERTFGWLMRQYRLVRDYERTETSAEAWVYLAMIRLQLRRLA